VQARRHPPPCSEERKEKSEKFWTRGIAARFLHFANVWQKRLKFAKVRQNFRHDGIPEENVFRNVVPFGGIAGVVARCRMRTERVRVPACRMERGRIRFGFRRAVHGTPRKTADARRSH
jgi:hypothetical protein